jgi:uncharacterized delta-60 repeat protein
MKRNFLLSVLFILSVTITNAQLPDPSFGRNGVVRTDMGSSFNSTSAGRQVLYNSDGSIYIVIDQSFISKRLPDGSLDSSYGHDGYSSGVDISNASAAIQPDGKIVLVGISNGNSFNVARINANGKIDSGFGNNGIRAINFAPSSVAVQNDGKIVIAGASSNVNNDNYFAVARFNTNGTADNTFNGNGQVTTNFGLNPDPRNESEYDVVNSVAIQADGKIIAGGTVLAAGGTNFALARYNNDGSLDNSFDGDGKQTTAVGSSSDRGNSLVIQSDNKILLAGYSSNGTTNLFAVVRYNTDGSPDNSFNGNGRQTINVSSDARVANSVALQGTGKIIIAGYTLNGSLNDFAVARLNTNGTIDNSFGGDGILTTDISSSDDYANSVAIQSDDKILVGGYTVTGPVVDFALVRYDTDGNSDNTFGNNGKLAGDSKQGNTQFFTTAIQQDGKIIAGGVTWNGNDRDFALVRYNTNGTLDSTFSEEGKQTTDFGGNNEYGMSVAIQNDGKIILSGYTFDNLNSTYFTVARYNFDGTPDNTFNGNGKLIISISGQDVCESVLLQTDGKILLAGYTLVNGNSSAFTVVRLNTDGSADNTFGVSGKQTAGFGFPAFLQSAALQKDGKIVAAGYGILNNHDVFVVARYNTDGNLDNTFSGGGFQTSSFGNDNYFGNSLALQTDDKIVVGGYQQNGSGSTSSSFVVARYKANGNLDSSFNNYGFQTSLSGEPIKFGAAVKIINGTEILEGGSDGQGRFALVLYKSDGSLDSSFSNNGIEITDIGIRGGRYDATIRSMAISGDALYAAGYGQFPGYQGVVVKYLLPTAGPLPVTLTDFTATFKNNIVALQWQTASEQNLSHFIIERSADGNNFSLIGNVTAKGNSSIKINYAALDQQPLQGINYYRLKIFDTNGKFVYSKIVSVNMKGLFTLRIFPNPAGNILFVQANGENEKALFKITDIAGRKLKEVNFTLNGTASIPIDISTLPKGIYNLVLLKNNKIQTLQFIKER